MPATAIRSKILRWAIARWGRATRGVTLGVRVVAIDEGGRLMLVRHGYAPGWYLPGGAVDPGESAQEAAVRELAEETGLVAHGPPRLRGLFFNPRFGGRDHVALFHAERFSVGPPPPYGREIAERGWFALDALPDDVTDSTRRRLAELFEGAAPDGRW